MVERTDGAAPQIPLLPEQWRTGRIALGFYLDLADLARQASGDLIAPLIIAAVIEANLTPINQSAQLQFQYSDLDSIAPDELRRPVSINAVAASLGLPFETVRRRIKDLVAKGQMEMGPKGVVTPSRVLQSRRYLEATLVRYERLKAFYATLKSNGALTLREAQAPFAETAPPLDPARPPIRLCNRVLSEFFLRVAEVTQRGMGDPATGLVLLNLARANIRRMSLQGPDADPLQNQTAMQPIRPGELAARIGMPTETVRRRLNDLKGDGFLVNTGDGLLVSPAALASPLAQSIVQGAAANTQRLFTRLHRYGVLDLWDREAAAEA